MVQDRERSETLEEEGVTTEDPTNVTKGQSYRLRVTVPASDESTIAWLDAQHDKLASVCLAIHEAIARHGYADLVHGPVELGSEQVVTESQPMAFTIANARMVYEAIRADERRREDERDAQVWRMMARQGLFEPGSRAAQTAERVHDDRLGPGREPSSGHSFDPGDVRTVEVGTRSGVSISGDPSVTERNDTAVDRENVTVNTEGVHNIADSGNADGNTDASSDSGDQNTQYDIDDIMSQFRRE